MRTNRLISSFAILSVLTQSLYAMDRPRRVQFNDHDAYKPTAGTSSSSAADLSETGKPEALLTKQTFISRNELRAWMKTSGILKKYHLNRLEIADIFSALKNYDATQFIEATTWIQTTEILDKCEYPWNISNILYVLKDYEAAKFAETTTWMKTSGALAKCQSWREIFNLLSAIKDYKATKFTETTTWMKTSGALDKCQNGKEISDILSTLKAYEATKFTEATTWIKTSGALDKCQNGQEISDILFNVKDYETTKLEAVTAWMKTSGALDKCQNGFEILDIVLILERYAVTPWMRSSGFCDKCLNGKEIYNVLKALRNFNVTLFTNTMKPFPVDLNYCSLYAAGYALEDANKERYQTALEGLIQDPHTRENALERISDFYGPDHENTQRFIQLAIGYENAHNPDSFLAVHQEMLYKRLDSVTHTPHSIEGDVALNIDMIQEAATFKPIFMPFNVWERQFKRLKGLSQDQKTSLSKDVLNHSLEDLMKLENMPLIKDLLDPKGSLSPRNKLCIHSHRLRAILKQCDQSDDVLPFAQLLLNIQTCPTGVKNGITHSYIFMNHGRDLSEEAIGSDRFTQEISHFFKEELRRLRETSLTSVLGQLKVENDPHNLYYLRNVIGSEIGLLQAHEIPSLDMNANAVSRILRAQTKQQLLDLFYGYYKVEDVVGRVHYMLNNGAMQVVDGSSLSSSSSSSSSAAAARPENLTLGIINAYLREDAYDIDDDRFNTDFVLLGADRQPKGFTPKAAKKLLLKMGILVPATSE